MSETLKEAPVRQSNDNFPSSIPLELKVEDRDTIQALEQYEEGTERDDFALEALKIGVLALRHASSALDADFIQRETTRLVETLGQQLETHTQQTQERLTSSLKEYFDPDSGRFSQRVKQLTSDDGDLSEMLKGMFDGKNSQLANTLLSHFGETSPLMKMLSPDQSQGLLAMLRDNVDTQLKQQRDRLLREFSLNNREGALCQLVDQIAKKNDSFTKNMELKIDDAMKEFSLDKEDSALSRLVTNVDSAQKKITQEFSLDNKQSALHKLKEELTTILSANVETNNTFQEKVMVALGKLVIKRETEARGTQHGLEFEAAVFEFLSREAQHVGDIATSTGNSTGLIKNCKIGDCVIELGPDSVASGAKIAVEAKEDASYTLARALEEMEKGRKNRGANWGIFIFSKKTAPAELEPFQRYGRDLVVVWDAEQPSFDVYLKAGIVTARALSLQAERNTESQQADFEAIDRAILDIEKRASNLSEVKKFAETIISSSKKIILRTNEDKKALEKQVSALRENLKDLRTSRESIN